MIPVGSHLNTAIREALGYSIASDFDMPPHYSTSEHEVFGLLDWIRTYKTEAQITITFSGDYVTVKRYGIMAVGRTLPEAACRMVLLLKESEGV